jgi:hypothetical protein
MVGRTVGVAGWLAVVLCLAACRSEPPRESTPFARPPDPNEPPPRDVVQASKPWTERFLAPAVLVADEVRIEGPAPLLEHVVTRPEADVHEFEVKTTAEGLLQTIRVRPGAGAEIRAQLDQLVISAMKRLVVLERPGPVDVRVTAAGDVFWKDTQSGQEQRAQTLRLDGPIRR